MPSITLYTQPACSQCNMTKKWLDNPDKGNLKDQYRVIDLTESPDDLAAVKALGYMSAPVVIVNDDGDTSNEKHWYGFRPDLLAEFCKAPAAA
ncbi:thioredoxin domain [Arthrobacter phage Kumotta]|uniref:Thioredoxin n=2 Tax=Kumottavirus TaxID=3044749 RepID=A0A4Y6ELH1_9CAUD|nr:thioredoxin domain [Arthrobacter phage Kumotta]YP_010649535.1 thioredoxin domain [Arthrobacter phage MargaretKali]AXH44433.1 thioredoxin [Arthrobacter phage MargaretKali]QDF19566.1 thioredoxin [Arthrobacter phage Kumotta]